MRHRFDGPIVLAAGVRTQASNPSLAYKGYLYGRICPDQCIRMTWHRDRCQEREKR